MISGERSIKVSTTCRSSPVRGGSTITRSTSGNDEIASSAGAATNVTLSIPHSLGRALSGFGRERVDLDHRQRLRVLRNRETE